jgi:hypothetical protein
VQSAFLHFAWGGVFLCRALIAVLRQGLPAGICGYIWGVVHVAAVVCGFYAAASGGEGDGDQLPQPVHLRWAPAFFGERLSVAQVLAIAVAALIGAGDRYCARVRNW